MAHDTTATRISIAGNFPENSIRFEPSALALENYLYLRTAGSYTAEGATVLKYRPQGYALIYAMTGIGRIELGERRCVLSAHDGILINRDYEFSATVEKLLSDSFRFLCFTMDGASFHVYYEQASAHRAIRERDNRHFSRPIYIRFKAEEGSALDAFIQKLSQAAMLNSPDRSELVASTSIISILTELIMRTDNSDPTFKPMPRYIEGIIKYVNDRYRRHITLDELASEFNVSKYHLSREFKRYTGFSPNEYLVSVRINRAKELLRNTNRSISEIAQITGCGDANHFIQLFKARENVTPAVFRRQWNR